MIRRLRTGSSKRRRRTNRTRSADRSIRLLQGGRWAQRPRVGPNRRTYRHRRCRSLDRSTLLRCWLRRHPLRRPCTRVGTTGRWTRSGDVIGWNTVYDPVNRRPYTALSRNWSSSKFGGFGVWLDDVLYHALLAGILDLTLAEENLHAVLAGRTEAGNLPCLLTGRDAWVDRSQPPIGAFVLWLLYQRWGERRLLDSAYETLLDNHEWWWWRERDGNGNGLLEYGTSPVGDGLYRGTALAARDESSMDNSPVHDEAVLVPESHTLDCEDVGLNSLLVLDGEMLALAAAELGRDREARRLQVRARALAARVGETLWDPEREVFANRLWSGRFVSSIAPTSFYPLIAGAASPAQARAVLGWIEDPRRFGGPIRAALGVARRPPPAGTTCTGGVASGRLSTSSFYQGLRRYGFAAEAAALAHRSYEMFAGPWREARQCAENYGGAGRSGHRSAGYRHLLRLGRAHAGDRRRRGVRRVSVGRMVDRPYRGRMFGWGRCAARSDGRGARRRLESSHSTWMAGRCCARPREAGSAHLRLERGSLSLELPPAQPARARGERPWLELPGVSVGALTTASLGAAAGERLAVTAGSDGVRLILPHRPSRTWLTLMWQS